MQLGSLSFTVKLPGINDSATPKAWNSYDSIASISSECVFPTASSDAPP